MLVSVIVPVYKVEKYLDRCVDSIVNQTYKNLEIILVDDGSPDDCPKMCDDWAKKDSRIKVIHKENGGLSDARNAGLKIATGEYVAFVDSDDYVDKTMYEKMVAKLTKDKQDVCFCYYVIENENGEKFFIKENFDGVTSDNIRLKYLLNNQKHEGNIIHTDGILATVWRGLYKKTLFNNLQFEYGLFCEDIVFHMQLFKQNLSITVVEDWLYFYIQREGSIINSYNEQKLKNKLIFIKRIMELIKDDLPSEEVERYGFFLYKSFCYDVIFSDIKNKKDYLQEINYLNSKKGFKLHNKYVLARKTKIANFLVHKRYLNILKFLLK